MKLFYRLSLLFFVFGTPLFSTAQVDFSAEASFQGLGAVDGELPFWMYSNKRGRIAEGTNFASWMSGKGVYQLSPASYLEAGAGILYQDERDQLQLDELYLSFQNSWMQAIVGRKQKKELYNGLSSSNESILWSLNARPLPGIQLSTTRPVFFWKKAGLGFEASWEEYLMEEDRHVSHARLHHKSFRLVFQPVSSFRVRAGLQHFVQWAGTSASLGKQPSSFEDYLLILTGQGGGEDAPLGDQQNALGNNIGGYELYIDTRIRNLDISLFWNHLFEDGTGQRMVNKPDGRYGIFIEDREPQQWLRSMIYEFYYTKHQSHTTIGAHKYDNYFNNGVYRSGWTYEDRVIGVPFFLTNPDGPGIISNRFIAHHLGLGGVVGKLPFRLLSSYRKNYGTNGAGLYDETENVFSGILEVNLLRSFMDIGIQVGADYSSDTGGNLGAGLKIRVPLL